MLRLSISATVGKARHHHTIRPLRPPGQPQRANPLVQISPLHAERPRRARHVPTGFIQGAQNVFPLLESYGWPGNARELRNVIERMAILTQAERLTRDSIPVEVRVQREAGPKSTIQEARESAEREHILRALDESSWNVSGAARALGMERTNLHKRIRALGLTRGQ